MRTVHLGPAAGLATQLALLAALAGSVGLGAAGWTVGMACGLGTAVLLARGLRRQRTYEMGPADWVTLGRAALVGTVAALVADLAARHTTGASLGTLVALASVALVLDAVDGQVARRTGTVSPFGARFDMEVDAFLILVLSLQVAPDYGGWVLFIGVARYARVAAGWVLPWLRRTPPPRYWCKVVAAVQGIVLTVAAAGVLPTALTYAALLTALALLAESFAHEVVWLWRNRPAESPGTSRRVGGARATAATGGAFLLVWLALVAPSDVRGGLSVTTFLVIPLEALALAAVLVVAPAALRAPLAAGAGLVLGLLTVFKALDVGFLEALGRPFDPIGDLPSVSSAVGLLDDSLGRVGGVAAAVAIGALALAFLLLVPLSVLRLARVAGRHRPAAARMVLAVGAVWALAAAVGLHTGTGQPVASVADSRLAVDHVAAARASLQEHAAFQNAVAHDPYGQVPGSDLLTGLRGKDVLLVFVESYGKVAVDGSTLSKTVVPALDAGTARLTSAGYGSRSAFLTSPTYGGISWLAHSTLQSGLWVTSQARYNQLIAGQRLTLSDAFHRAGWRTVSDVPSNRRPWPEGSAFYHFDQAYDAHNVGYAGPSFSYATMPDQYTLSAFQRLELQPGPRAPVMGEIDLVSSHLPWAPLPRLVGWSDVGNGSVYAPMPSQGLSPGVVWRSPASIQKAYADSIVYSMNALVGFLQQAADPNLVLVVLGDHQPVAVVSGVGASHDVPITLIARDPAVLAQAASWGWQAGLRPGAAAPVWRMDAFRDRFLAAFGSAPPAQSPLLVAPRQR